MRDRRVMVLGSLHLDFLFVIPRPPEEGECLLTSHVTKIPGGKGANQAFYAAQSGAPTQMAGYVGDDEAGQVMIRALEEVGVDTQDIKVAPGKNSGLSSAWIVEDSGDYRAVVASGANQCWSTADVDGLLEQAPPDSWLLLQYEIPHDVIIYAAQQAYRRGLHVVVNAAPFDHLETLYPYVELLIVNQIEAGQFVGSMLTSEQDCWRALEAISARFPAVVITLGGEGLLYSCSQQKGRIAARAVTVADSHGAGDSFVGALTAALFAGENFYSALEQACNVACQVVQRHGPRHRL